MKKNKEYLYAVIVLVVMFVSGMLYMSSINETLNNEVDELNDCMSRDDERWQLELEECNLNKIILELTLDNGEQEKLTTQSLWDFIQECQPWYPDLIMANAIIEAGNGGKWNCQNSIHRNNIVGMRKPKLRQTTAINCQEHDGCQWAKYKNWKLCIVDRILWEINIFGQDKPSREEYVDTMCSIYASDKNYRSKLTQIAKLYK